MSFIWQAVPLKYIEEWDKIFNFNKEGINISNDCPICNQKTLHRYYDLGKRFRELEERILGGEWQWCSSCKCYSHSSGVIPKWWKCDISIDNSILTPIPNILDLILKDPSKVDKWVKLPYNLYDAWKYIFSKNIKTPKLDDNCPNCGSNLLYQYYTCDNVMVKYKKNIWKGRGGNWRWCGYCFNYTYNYYEYVPYEWDCLLEVNYLIEKSDLMTIPEPINEIYKIYNL